MTRIFIQHGIWKICRHVEWNRSGGVESCTDTIWISTIPIKALLKASSKERPNCLDVTEGKSYHSTPYVENMVDPDRPLFAFIGRLVDQKADLLASVIQGFVSMTMNLILFIRNW